MDWPGQVRLGRVGDWLVFSCRDRISSGLVKQESAYEWGFNGLQKHLKS